MTRTNRVSKQFAVDSKGNIWIADEENNRISEFSEAGVFVKAIGWGVTDVDPYPDIRQQR